LSAARSYFGRPSRRTARRLRECDERDLERRLFGAGEVPGGEGALQSCAGTAFRGHEHTFSHVGAEREDPATPSAPIRHDEGRRSGRSAPLDRKARRCRCCRGVPVDHKPPGLTGRPRGLKARCTRSGTSVGIDRAALFDASARPQLDMGRVWNPHQSAGRRGGYARDSRWGESLAAVDREPAAGPACGLGCAAENPPCKVATEDPSWCRGVTPAPGSHPSR
jgi:hypothetical protein